MFDPHSRTICYRGIRNANGTAEVFKVLGKPDKPTEREPLDPRNDLCNHSPDGFEWGYGGSGPGQLAFALCVSEIPIGLAFEIYQDFKWRVVARLESEWVLPVKDVRDAIRAILSHRAAVHDALSQKGHSLEPTS